MTQEQRIKKRLIERGEISRNECIRNYITRLSAIIFDLKEEGWDFDPKKVGNDYVYKVIKSPIKKTVPLMTQEGTVRLLSSNY